MIIHREDAHACWQLKQVLQPKDPSYDGILMACDLLITKFHNGKRPNALENKPCKTFSQTVVHTW